MKILFAGILTALLFTGGAMAQLTGLQIAETADPAEKGMIQGTLGVVSGEFEDTDIMFYGARLSGAVAAGVLLFGDIGIVDFDDPYDSELGIQVGGIWSLPVESPIDLALRGTVFKPFLGDVTEDGVDVDTEIWGLTAMLMGSVDCPKIEGLSLYGGVGLNYATLETDVSSVDPLTGTAVSASEDEDETDVIASGGAILGIMDNISLYAEVSYVDDVFLGAGARMQF